jgi:hypothetical protein
LFRSQEARFFVARFFSLARLSRASFFNKSAFDTLRTILSALLSRSAGVSPGTFGAGFISSSSSQNLAQEINSFNVDLLGVKGEPNPNSWNAWRELPHHYSAPATLVFHAKDFWLSGN